MKNVIVAVVCLVVGFVAGVFTGRCGAGANTASGADKEIFSGEAKDGELVEIEKYGKFRLNPKQKELVEKKKLIKKFDDSVVNDRALCTKLEMENPWLLDVKIAREVEQSYRKMVIALLESRKKAQTNN